MALVISGSLGNFMFGFLLQKVAEYTGILREIYERCHEGYLMKLQFLLLIYLFSRRKCDI